MVNIEKAGIIDDKLFRFIVKCQRKHNVPDMHSFNIDIKNGKAYVECRSHEVFIESRIYESDSEKISRWCGTTIAAANRLDALNADYATIDM